MNGRRLDADTLDVLSLMPISQEDVGDVIEVVRNRVQGFVKTRRGQITLDIYQSLSLFEIGLLQVESERLAESDRSSHAALAAYAVGLVFGQVSDKIEPGAAAEVLDGSNAAAVRVRTLARVMRAAREAIGA
ncbi:MAG: hypothetical protein AB7F99_09510 [Vicinamibacterales bacterium]